MKHSTILLINLLISICAFSQKHELHEVYSITTGELIFAWSNASFTDEFKAANPASQLTSNNLRFSLFFHLAENWHYDITSSFGMLTGIGVRNVGMSTNEVHDFNGDGDPENYKFVRRSYLVGVPFGLKLGSLKNNLYMFGGFEYELAFHYKQKYWEAHTRTGGKTIDKKWFGEQTPTFMPSFFVGVQFPKGIHLTVKHYFYDFLNTDYGNDTDPINDFSRYAQSQITYISLNWQFRPNKIRQSVKKENSTIITSL